MFSLSALGKYDWKLYGTYSVCALGTYGLSVGAVGGAKSWFKWYKNRSAITFSNPNIKYLESIVNTSVISGKFIYELFYHSLASMFVTLTFPISIPLLLSMCDTKDENDEEYDD